MNQYIKKQRFVVFTFLLFVTVGLLVSCNSKTDRTNAMATATELMDQPYGDHEKQKCDLFLPAGRSAKSTPVLFLIHGGAWAAGDRTNYHSEIKRLQNIFPQMAFVSVGYRLADGKTMTNLFPTQEEDVKACVQYVLDHRKQYGISKKYALYGGSAGAHLAILHAYKHGRSAYKPAAVVSMVGPTNLSKAFEQVMMTDDPNKEMFFSWYVNAIGGTLEEKPDICYSSSPINYVTSKSPPTLMLYGEDDTIVPWQQADELDAKLTALGVKHIYKLYPGQNHGLTEVIPELYKELEDFLRFYLY